MQNDASFRHYYRCTINCSSYVVMDAPPDKENIVPFIKITQILSQFNILVPQILAYDLEYGFIVLSDLGDTWLLECLNQATPVQALNWYQKAIQGIIQIQEIPTLERQLSDYIIPRFDSAHIRLELSYFSDWFLKQLLKLDLSPVQESIVEQASVCLIQSAALEPQVLIHRDYHSRNLMVLPDEKLGIIDYQDAMIGPLSYDLASLLKDCYITWPQEHIEACVRYFYDNSPNGGMSLAQFTKAFDLIGLQRHLKVLGIFSRLHIRDHKSHYLNDIPRIIEYVMNVVSRYPELSQFYTLWQHSIIPAFSHYQVLREQETKACVL